MAVTDNFNRANDAGSLGVSTSGHLWVPDTGVLGINAVQAYSATPGAVNVAVIDHLAADGAWGVDCAADPGAGPGPAEGLVLRWVGPGSYYRVMLYHSEDHPGPGKFILVQRYDAGLGTVTTHLSAVAATGSAGFVAGRLEAVVTGSSWDIYYAGVLKGSFTAATWATSTVHGISIESAAATARLDNYAGPEGTLAGWVVGSVAI